MSVRATNSISIVSLQLLSPLQLKAHNTLVSLILFAITQKGETAEQKKPQASVYSDLTNGGEVVQLHFYDILGREELVFPFQFLETFSVSGR